MEYSRPYSDYKYSGDPAEYVQHFHTGLPRHGLPKLPNYSARLYVGVKGSLGSNVSSVVGLSSHEREQLSAVLRRGPKEDPAEVTYYNGPMAVINNLEYYLGYHVLSCTPAQSSDTLLWTLVKLEDYLKYGRGEYVAVRGELDGSSTRVYGLRAEEHSRLSRLLAPGSWAQDREEAVFRHDPLHTINALELHLGYVVLASCPAPHSQLTWILSNNLLP